MRDMLYFKEMLLLGLMLSIFLRSILASKKRKLIRMTIMYESIVKDKYNERYKKLLEKPIEYYNKKLSKIGVKLYLSRLMSFEQYKNKPLYKGLVNLTGYADKGMSILGAIKKSKRNESVLFLTQSRKYIKQFITDQCKIYMVKSFGHQKDEEIDEEMMSGMYKEYPILMFGLRSLLKEMFGMEIDDLLEAIDENRHHEILKNNVHIFYKNCLSDHRPVEENISKNNQQNDDISNHKNNLLEDVFSDVKQNDRNNEADISETSELLGSNKKAHNNNFVEGQDFYLSTSSENSSVSDSNNEKNNNQIIHKPHYSETSDSGDEKNNNKIIHKPHYSNTSDSNVSTSSSSYTSSENIKHSQPNKSQKPNKHKNFLVSSSNDDSNVPHKPRNVQIKNTEIDSKAHNKQYKDNKKNDNAKTIYKLKPHKPISVQRPYNNSINSAANNKNKHNDQGKNKKHKEYSKSNHNNNNKHPKNSKHKKKERKHYHKSDSSSDSNDDKGKKHDNSGHKVIYDDNDFKKLKIEQNKKNKKKKRRKSKKSSNIKIKSDSSSSEYSMGSYSESNY